MMDSTGNTSDIYSILNNSVIENEDGDISSSKVKLVSLVCGIILIPAFCLLGSIGNVISLRVLSHQRMRNQVNYVLAALCVSDTLFLIHCLIYTGLNIYRKLQPDNGATLRAHVYPIVGAYGSVVTARITSCLTLLLCVERFVAVYFPLRARDICSNKNTCISVGFIYFITIVLFIPLSLKYEAKQICLNTTTNNYRTIMSTTDLFENNTKFFSIYGTFLNILFRFAPLFLIPILNILMIRILHKNWRQRREMNELDRENSAKLTGKETKVKSKSNSHHSTTTIMLLTVSFIFFICILPGAIHSIATHIWPGYSNLGQKKNLYFFLGAITFLLETINSSVNFIIYMAMSRKFRLLYKEIFCCGHGQYIRKISVSSIKERFRWSSRKRASERGSRGGITRKSYSDVGPSRKNSCLPKENVKYDQLKSGRDNTDSKQTVTRKSCDLKLFQPNGHLVLKKDSNGFVINGICLKKHLVHSASDCFNGNIILNPKLHIFAKDVKCGECTVCNNV